MMFIGDWILCCLSVAVAIPLLTLAFECFLSLLPVRRNLSSIDDRPTCGILVPAHNEGAGIVATVRNLASKLRPGDVLLVVADNCTDDTARLAVEAGATVTERQDPDHRGKGFALDYGLKHLPPELPIVLIVDADCEIESDGVDRLVLAAHSTGRPAQGIYLIGTGQESDPKRQLSAFAVLLKNQIRPLGLHRAGLPCLLTGAGMAFPRGVLDRAQLGSGNIVEDMRLGIDLALLGHTPVLVPEVRLHGAAAPDKVSAIKQRTRWEHGHVATLLYGTPRLIWQGITRFRPGTIALGMELGVPPLSLLGMLAILVGIVCVVWWQFAGNLVPMAIVGSAISFAFSGILAAWVKYGRSVVRFGTLIRIPAYVLWKLPIYAKLLVGRQQKWVRTARSTDNPHN